METETKAKKHTGTEAQGEWHVLDAKEEYLGRICTKAAHLLIGKHRPDYTPNILAPVYVIIINTDQLKLSGSKADNKEYHNYSGYPGGLHTRTFAEQMRRDSRKIVETAIYGMLPKNNSRDDRMRKLKLYKTAEHPHLPQINTPVSK